MLVSDEEIVALGERGWFLRDGFVGSAVTAAARQEAEGMTLRSAGMGRGQGYHLSMDERGDEIAWLDRTAATPAIGAIIDAFDALRTALNETAYLGLTRFDVQLARYAPGGRYVRHRDAHGIHTGLTQRRLVTAILYLNPAWTPADGGQLRIYPDPDPATDIPPLSDRLVVFLSPRIDHEVLPSSTRRFALTAWYLRHP